GLREEILQAALSLAMRLDREETDHLLEEVVQDGFRPHGVPGYGELSLLDRALLLAGRMGCVERMPSLLAILNWAFREHLDHYAHSVAPRLIGSTIDALERVQMWEEMEQVLTLAERWI